MGCEIGMGPVVVRLAWISMGDGFWPWLWVVLGLLANGLGLLVVGGVGFASFSFFFFWWWWV